MDATVEPSLSITARLPKSLKVELDTLALATGRDRDALVQEALKQYFAFQAQQIEEIKAGIQEADAGIFVSGADMDDLWAEFGVESSETSGRAG